MDGKKHSTTTKAPSSDMKPPEKSPTAQHSILAIVTWILGVIILILTIFHRSCIVHYSPNDKLVLCNFRRVAYYWTDRLSHFAPLADQLGFRLVGTTFYSVLSGSVKRLGLFIVASRRLLHGTRLIGILLILILTRWQRKWNARAWYASD